MASESNLDTERPSFLNRSVIIIGKRACGKTELLKHIYHQIYEQIDEAYLFCEPKIALNDRCHDPDSFKSVYNQVSSNGKSKLFILDDRVYDKDIRESDEFKHLILNKRHTNSTVLITMQYPVNISPLIRCNIDYILTVKDRVYSNQQRMYQMYLGCFPTIKIMLAYLDTLEPYEFACVPLSGTHHDICKIKGDLVKEEELKSDKIVKTDLAPASAPSEPNSDIEDILQEFERLQEQMKAFGVKLTLLE